jgi:hypothetical protein
MPGALAFVALLAACYAFAFGATRLLLRKTFLESYSLEAPLLAGPALAILGISLLGYSEPFLLPAWHSWLVFSVGCGLSAVVAVWEWRALLELLGAHWQRLVLVCLPACLGAGLMLWFFPGNEWDDVFVPWVNEYVNYAELGAVLTGHHQGQPGTAVTRFCHDHHQIRWGQDLLVAATAQIAGVHPMQSIVPLAVLCRFQYAVALGLILCALSPTRRDWKLVLAILLLDAVLLLELLFQASSFFSSNCTAPLFMVYLVWLARLREFRAREAVVLLLLNLFFLLTYPEFLLVTKGLEALALAVAWQRHLRACWMPLLACNLALVAMHPLLIHGRLALMFSHLTTPAGWNVVGDPVLEPWQFLGNLLGFRYGHLTADPLGGLAVLVWPLLGALTVIAAVGCWALARRYQVGWALATVAVLLLGVHLAAYLRNGNYYTGFKVLTHVYFVGVVILAGGLLLWRNRQWQWLGLAVFAGWLAGAGGSTYRLVGHIHHKGYPVSYTELRDALTSHANRKPIAVLCSNREPLMLANLVAGESDVRVAFLTQYQSDMIAVRGLADAEDHSGVARDGTLHDGVVLADAGVLESGSWSTGPDILELHCRRVLCRVGRLAVCEARICMPNSLTLPPWTWVETRTETLSPLFARSGRLVLTGHIAEQHPLPYRFTCVIEEANWSQDVVLRQRGEFEITLELPSAMVGKAHVVKLTEYDTFRPCECIAGNPDQRRLGFLLRAVRFD